MSQLGDNEDFQIISSPSMFEKIEKMENSINSIEISMLSILDRINSDHSSYSGNRQEYITMLQKIEELSQTNKDILQENRKMYTQSLEKIAEISKSNKDILQENRKMYTDALKKIQNTEEKNMEEIRPILNEMTENTQKLENNICDPHLSSRIFYRNWRNSAIPNNTEFNNLNGLLGMPFITGLSSVNNSINKNTIN